MPFQKKVVVIVDNNVSTELEDLERVLFTEDDGRKYDVFSFQDPKEVVDCLNSEEGMFYDLAVVDLVFESSHRGYKEDGTGIVNLMKEVYPCRPVLCCSAYAQNAHIRSEFRTCKHKPDGVFSKKKYDAGTMLDIVEGFIKKFESRKSSHVP